MCSFMKYNISYVHFPASMMSFCVSCYFCCMLIRITGCFLILDFASQSDYESASSLGTITERKESVLVPVGLPKIQVPGKGQVSCSGLNYM